MGRPRLPRLDALPELDPGWSQVEMTPSGRAGLRVRLAVKEHGWTERRVADAVGISIAQVRGLLNRGYLVLMLIGQGEYRLRVDPACRHPLPIDGLRSARCRRRTCQRRRAKG